jgi:hypothetical protein
MQRKEKKRLQIICIESKKGTRDHEWGGSILPVFFFFPSEIPFSLFDVWVFVCLFLLPKEMVDNGTQEFCQQSVCVCVCVFVLFCGYFHNKNTKVSK